jgi:hypothetical protein
MPEITHQHPAEGVSPVPASDHGEARKAIALALGASTSLTAGWGLLSGLTERHFTLVLPVIGAVIALALTSTAARRSWFPALAAALGFAVGYLGDITAVTLLLWRDGLSLSVIAGHAPTLIRAADDSHSAADWAYFLGSAAVAYAATAARQKALAAHLEPTGPR